MISKISFGSTYKVNRKDNERERFSQFQRFAHSKEVMSDVTVRLKDGMNSRYPYNYYAQYTLIAPDVMDDEIETYCMNQGIRFKKLTNDELLNPFNVLSRIEEPKEGMKKVYVNPDKLEKLIKKQFSNIKHCEKDYANYYHNRVNNNIKSGDEIYATTLSINSKDSTEEILSYIRRYGADNLNPKQLFVDFNQETDEADQCTYFALRDMGMKDIPMYVDNDTYRIANALNLLN